MSIESIVAEIDIEISRLKQAKELLSGQPTLKRGPGRPRLHTVQAISPAKPKKRKMSAAGRAKIAAAQKARWAKLKAGSGKGVATKSKSA